MQLLRLFLVLVFALLGGLFVAGPPRSSASSPTPGSCPTPIIEYSLPEPLTGSGDITAGPDGNLYFTAGDGIWRVTPDGQFSVANSTIGIAGIVSDLTAGPDGNVWFTAYSPRFKTSRIGRLTPAGETTVFDVPADGQPESITTGPDGNLWFTEPEAGRVGRITPLGEVTEFNVGPVNQTGPWDITSGPDGNLWFTNQYTTTIRQITPGGELTPLVVRTAEPSNSITTGSDGNLWFTQSSQRKMVRFAPPGNLTEFTIPYGVYYDITLGPDGNIWFQTFEDSIGRITSEGVVAEVPLSTSGIYVLDLTSGPDGSIWFTQTTNKLGKVIVGLEHCSFMPLIHRNAP